MLTNYCKLENEWKWQLNSELTNLPNTSTIKKNATNWPNYKSTKQTYVLPVVVVVVVQPQVQCIRLVEPAPLQRARQSGHLDLFSMQLILLHKWLHKNHRKRSMLFTCFVRYYLTSLKYRNYIGNGSWGSVLEVIYVMKASALILWWAKSIKITSPESLNTWSSNS